MKLPDKNKIIWIVSGALALGVANWAVFRFYPKSFSIFAYVIFLFVPLLAVLVIVFLRFSFVFLNKISEKEKDEVLLQERQKEIVESMIEGLVVHDAGGKILALNSAAEFFLGIKESEARGKFYKEVKNQTPLLKILFEEFDLRNEFECTIKDGNGQELSLEVIKVSLSKEKGEILKIIRDVSRARYLDRMKTEYITIISHKFLTPLTNIKWAASALFNKEINEDKKNDNINNIINNAEKLVKLTSSLLDITEIEEGLFGYKFEKVDLGALIREVIQNYHEESKMREIEVVFNKSDGDYFVRGDRSRLNAAVANYLDNSIKYTPSNGKIEINLIKEDNNLKMTIKDSGIGISQEGVPSLFSKFYRDKRAKAVHTEGSGLGLFIVKNIIEKHGGTAGYIAGKEDAGATFYFALPEYKEKTAL